MTIKDPDAIKKTVKSNFDESPSQYESFEIKYGLFSRVTKELANICKVEKGMKVCDVGCGTGASTFALAELVGKEGHVTGIDFSEEMLSIAKKKVSISGQSSSIDLLCCDAEAIDECVDIEMDAVLYNACVFLIPNIERTLEGAQKVLKPEGIIGMNYIIRVQGMESSGGETRAKGIDIFQSAKETGLKYASYGRSISDMTTIPSILRNLGFNNLQEGEYSERMPVSQLRDFCSIPAQSAGLYPKTPYEERLELLNSLLNHYIEKGFNEFNQVWGWYSGIKKSD